MDLSEAASQVNHKIKLAQHSIRLRLDEALRPMALTKAQYVALYKLAETPGISNAELARQCFVSPQNMNVLIGGLKKLGLLATDQNETQGRIQKISLTTPGEELFKRATLIVQNVEKAIFEAFTVEDFRLLLNLLEKIPKSENRNSNAQEI